MTPRTVGLAIAVGLGAVGIVSLIKPTDAKNPTPLKSPKIDPTDVAEFYTPDQVDIDDDGGMTYGRLAKSKDGGRGKVKVATPNCVRRPIGVARNQCRRNLAGRGLGLAVQEVDDEDRFPASEATGPGCVPVACGLMNRPAENPHETDQQKYLRLVAEDGGGM